MPSPRPINAMAHPLSEAPSILQRLQRVPWLVILISLILSAIGVGALYSAAAGSWTPWAGQHLIRIGIGLVLMVIVASIPIWYYRKIAP